MKNIISLFKDMSVEEYFDIVEETTRVDANNLEDAMVRQSSIYASYSTMACMAKVDMERANRELEKFASMTRKQIKSESSSKMTAKDLDDAVFSHFDYDGYNDKYLEAKQKYEFLKGLVMSLNHKKDMLVQLSSHQREEKKLYN
tara:strand:+ start:797 stop:1228 length:432 start_codon:yes stop_codon:yes gene_type:complete